VLILLVYTKNLHKILKIIYLKVRACLGAMNYGNTGYLSTPQNKQKEKQKIITVIEAAICSGIYVLVDFHITTNVIHKKEAIEFFKEIFQQYGNSPNLLAEGYNEVVNVDWTVLKAFHEELIDVNFKI
jgi:endoglucanase